MFNRHLSISLITSTIELITKVDILFYESVIMNPVSKYIQNVLDKFIHSAAINCF